MNISDVESPSNWLHFSVAGSASLNQSYIRIDYQDQIYKMVNSSYVSITQRDNPWYVYLGVNATLDNGFIGDVREFLFTQTYIRASQVANIKNQVIFYDSRHNGNYRLQRGNIYDELNSLTLSSQMVYNSTEPTWESDSIPIDMCQPFVNTTYLPLLNSSKISFQKTTVNQRLQSTTDFAYSGSIWMRTLRGIKTTANTQTARNGLYSFRLEEVFDIWFSSTTSIRMFYHAQNNIFETATQPILFPLNQWANFQFSFSRTRGYELRVYDFKRRLLAIVNDTVYFEDQNPTGKFEIARNFQGYIKQLMIYNIFNTLPIRQSNGNWNEIYHNNLIMNYKFDLDYFNSDSSYFPSLAYTQSKKQGPDLEISSGRLPFYPIEWDQSQMYPDFSTSTLGSINQNYSLYDGVTCNLSRVYYRTTNRRSFISSEIELSDDLTEGTVEFWFRRTQPQRMQHYFFSLTDSSDQEYFSIYQSIQNSYLNCMPINSTDPRSLSPQLVMTNYSYEWVSWIHFACRFMKGYQLEGVLYNDLDGSEIFNTTDMRDSKVQIPANTYKIYIGNNNSTILGALDTFFKEVRFWKRSLPFYMIQKRRFQQLDPSTLEEGLILSYFKLTTSDYQVYDYLTFPDTAADTQGLVQDLDSQPSVLCPQYSYAIDNSTCVRNPIIQQKLLLIADGSAPRAITWRVTSLYSDFVNYYEQEAMLSQSDEISGYSFTWESPNQSFQKQEISQYTSSDLSSFQIPSNINSDNVAMFQVRNKITNNQDYSRFFQSEATLNFTLSKCRFLGDLNTAQTITDIVLRKNQTLSDLNLTVAVRDNCDKNTITDTLWTTMLWQAFPSSENITNFTSTYINASNSFNLTLRKEEFSKMPSNHKIYLIGTVYWNSTGSGSSSQQQQQQGGQTTNMNQGGTQQSSQNNNNNANNQQNGGSNQQQAKQTLSFLNIIYTITVLEELQPVVTASSNQVLIGEDLNLDAGDSYSLRVNDSEQAKAAISYKWICPPIFQSVCENYKNSKYLIVTYSQFQTSGLRYGRNYSFVLTVWKDTDIDDSFSYSTTYNVLWLQVFRPSFAVSYLNGQTSILASKDNSIQISLTNYDQSSGDLNITWSFDMEIRNASKTLSYSRNNTMLTLKQGALYPSTDYVLNITVENSKFPIAVSYMTLYFTTGESPYNGTVRVNQTQGIAMNTVFNISIAGWISDEVDSSRGIRYRVYGISNLIQSPFLLSYQYYYQNQSFISQLPQLQQLYLQIEDASTEVTYVTMDVQVSDNQFLDVVKSIQDEGITNTSQILDRFILGIYSVNQLDYNRLSSVILMNKVNMLNSMADIMTTILLQSNTSFDQTAILQQNQTDQRNLFLGRIMFTLPLITNSSLNSTVYTLAKSVLNQIKLTPEYTTLLSNYDFEQSYITLLNNLLNYQTQQSSSFYNLNKVSKGLGRGLQTSNSTPTVSQVLPLIQEMEDFADSYCQQIKSTSYGVQYTFTTTLMTLVLEKIAVPYLGFNRTYQQQSTTDAQSMQVPLNQIANAETTISNKTVRWTCIQAAFLNVNPVASFNLSNQVVVSNVVMSINSYNSNNTKILEKNGTRLAGNTFIQQFNYDPRVNTSYYLNNQTVCEYLPSTYSDYKNTSWLYDSYETNINSSSKQVKCSASFINATYMAIVTDTNRIYGDPSPDTIFSLIKALISFDIAISPVLVVLGLILIIFPIAALVLDKVDYNYVSQDSNELTDKEINLLLRLSKLKNVPIIKIQYQKSLIQSYYRPPNIQDKDFKEPVLNNGFCFRSQVVLKHIHPLFNLFSKFDVENKRLFRWSFLSIQTSIIAIVCTAIFGTSYRPNDQEAVSRETEYDKTDLYNAILAGCLLSLVTLPFPYKMLLCCRARLVKEETQQKNDQDVDIGGELKNSDETKRKVYDSKVTDHHLADGVADDNQNFEKERQYNSPKSDKRLASSQNDGKQENQQNATSTSDEVYAIEDKLAGLKIFIIVLSFIITMGAIAYAAISSSMISKANSKIIVISFFIAIVVGWFILNMLRVLISTIMASRIVEQLIEFDDQLSGCTDICDYFFVAQEAVIIHQDIACIKFIIENEEEDDEGEPKSKIIETNSRRPMMILGDNNQNYQPTNSRGSSLNKDVEPEQKPLDNEEKPKDKGKKATDIKRKKISLQKGRGSGKQLQQSSQDDKKSVEGSKIIPARNGEDKYQVQDKDKEDMLTPDDVEIENNYNSKNYEESGSEDEYASEERSINPKKNDQNTDEKTIRPNSTKGMNSRKLKNNNHTDQSPIIDKVSEMNDNNLNVGIPHLRKMHPTDDKFSSDNKKKNLRGKKSRRFGGDSSRRDAHVEELEDGLDLEKASNI